MTALASAGGWWSRSARPCWSTPIQAAPPTPPGSTALAADLAPLRARGQTAADRSPPAPSRWAAGGSACGSASTFAGEQQAAAAVGQIRLTQAWEEALAAGRHDRRPGADDARRHRGPPPLPQRPRHAGARCWRWACVPVVNENDTVATEEIRFGDNDRLAARVAQMMQADLLVLLSDVDGLYTADPRRDPAAAHMPVVEALTPEIEAMAGERRPAIPPAAWRPSWSRRASPAAPAARWQSPMATPSIRLQRSSLVRAVPGFSPHPKVAPPASVGSLVRWRHLAHWWWMPVPHARLPQVARCCRRAYARSTVTFQRGDPVVVRNASGRALARGLSAYASVDAERIAGHRSDEIEAILGWRGRDEIIHRDDLVLL